MKTSPVPVLFALVFFCGCGSEAEIKEYSVDAKSTYVRPTILLRDSYALPIDWDAPKAWQVAENDQFSKVAWSVQNGNQTARITLTQLGKGMDIPQQIFRWRDQIGATGNVTDGLDKISIEGIDTAIYVDLSGSKECIMGLLLSINDELWIFKLRGELKICDAQRSAFRTFCESISLVKKPAPLTWTVPDTWEAATNDQFSMAAWTVTSGDDTARITVTELAPQVSKQAQIDRWKGQLNTAEGEEIKVKETIVPIPKHYTESSGMIELSGPDEAILGFIMSNEQAVWVVKFRGSTAIADAERERFLAFCKSMSLNLGLK